MNGTDKTSELAAIRRCRRLKIGIFDHLSLRLGGSQLVVAWMAVLLSSKYQVDVIHSGKGYTLSSLGAAFDVDLSQASERIVGDSLGSFSRSLRSYLRHGTKAERALTEPYDLFIYVGHGAPSFSYARQGLIYCQFPFEERSLELTELWHKRHPLSRWIRLALYQWLWDRRMRGYKTVLANSHFTSGWIERLWGRQAVVIYPPVAFEAPMAEKRNIIVTLGRFINTDRKNHAQQLKAFVEFLARVGKDWSLCIIGFCADLPQDRAYLENLRQIAKNLPVTFVVNAERKTVLSHLAEAKLFWHTTGLNEEGKTEPRYMEHFGIATVEAMMSGCVPLVPMCGGQPEIVEHEVSGFLCNDLAELVRHSAYLAEDHSLWAEMSRRAIEKSRAFHPSVFEQLLLQQVSHCLGTAAG